MIYTLLKRLSALIVFLCLAGAFAWISVARPSLSTEEYSISEHGIADPKILESHVKTISEDFFPRDSAHPENLNALASHIRREFENYGLQVEEQVFSVEGQEYKNIIATHGPAGDSELIIGAHYDAHGSLPGADDNASGVAGLLEIGRLLKDKDLNSRITLVAFTLEEMPHFDTRKMGSAVYADSLANSSTPVRLMICLEMIGYFTEAPETQSFPAPLLDLIYPNTGNFIAIVDEMFSNQAQRMREHMRSKTSLPVYSINAPRALRGVDFSDHRSFWNRNYPAVMVTDTAFFRNQAYHTPHDTPESLNYRKMGEVVTAVFSYLMELDQART